MSQAAITPCFKNVLVIDDSGTDRYIAEYMLKKFHFCQELIIWESAPAALEYLRSLENTPEQIPQFIFLDIRMPEMDGFQFMDEFKNLPAAITSASIIIMLSTSLDPQDIERARANPYINRFLNKPFDEQKLEALKNDFSRKI